MNKYEIKQLAEAIVNNLTNNEIDKLSERIAHYIVKEQLPPVFTQEKAAEYIGKSYNALGQMCYRFQIPYHKVGGSKYFKREDLDNWLQNHGKK